MKLVVGLGNPGIKYEKTRHNVGFMVIDKLVDYYGLNLGKEEQKAVVFKKRIKGEKVIFVKPQTFMNNSGEAVGGLASYYKIDKKEDIIIIYDDLDLQAGQIKIKPKGGHGGHNGIKSIFKHLGVKDFPRVRIGIGRPVNMKVTDYVLGRFSKDEKDSINKALEVARDAIKIHLEDSLQQAMNKYN